MKNGIPIISFNKNCMRTLIFLLAIICNNSLHAQKDSADKIFAFKITGYIKPLTDSSTIVQVLIPEDLPVKIKEKQLATLLHCYASGTTLDTAMIGWGRCQLIKGDYYYFGLTLKKNQQPAEGNLLYIRTKLPFVYDGLLLNVMNHAINFTNVYGDEFMTANAIFTNTKTDELRLLDSMISDIRYTGSVMQKQMPEQDQLIKDGIFKGKKVFTAMQEATRNQLELFLKYMNARPKNYAGNTWKITEVFATWMTSATPTVLE
jgi:hypothetical protein